MIRSSLPARLIALLILCVACFLAVLYWRGHFEIPFIDRPLPKETAEETTAEEETTHYQDAYTDPDPLADSILDIMTPDAFQPENIPDTAKTIPSAESLLGEGYSRLSDGVFSGKSTLAQITLPISLPVTFSQSYKTVYRPVREALENGAGYVTNKVAETVQRPMLEVYMGYLIFNQNNTFLLADASGHLLGEFSIERFVPAYTRDSEDHPLFVTPEGAYYYYDEEASAFVASSYDDARHNRALWFDYPASFGKDESDQGRSYDLTSHHFALVSAAGKTITDYKYNMMASFVSGYRAVSLDVEIPDRESVLHPDDPDLHGVAATVNAQCFLNAAGKELLPGTRSYTTSTDRPVNARYVAPDTFGEESLGFFYFDHGLVRVREQARDHYYPDKVLVDTDYLIDQNGVKFPLPAGYRVVSYSNGMILLEKDGRYGYMNYRGVWIAQPIYTTARPFFGGLAVLGFDDGRIGMIDTEGNIVLPFLYRWISDNSDGVISAYRQAGGWSVYHVMQAAS